MTDTTTTITPEERASWRERLESPFSCHDAKFAAFTLRLLNALETAEKALLKEEVYSDELESQLQDAESEYNANWAVQAISDVARLVGVYEQCSETGDDIGAATLEAVQDLKAENARLRAENNALLECRKAEKALAPLTHTNDGIKGGWIKPWEREGLPKRLRAARERVKAARQGLEAARRAVAGEGEPS